MAVQTSMAPSGLAEVIDSSGLIGKAEYLGRKCSQSAPGSMGFQSQIRRTRRW